MDSQIIDQLFYHRLDICLSPMDDIRVDAWLGAVLRNNLMYAAESVEVKAGCSLRNMIDTLPLPEEHPLYKELSGGFPKGFVLSLQSHMDTHFIGKGEKILFSLVLVGSYTGYYDYFMEAIRKMCARGFGNPMVPLELIDIYEKHPYAGNWQVAVGYSLKLNPLCHPVKLSHFLQETQGVRGQEIGIRYETPTLLVNSRAKTNKEVSYQDKLNGFPSFYQLVRSVAFRVEKLAMLYACPDNIDFHSRIEADLGNAASLTLISASLNRTVLKRTAKKGRTERMPLPGYTGEVIFSGEFREYLPLLLFASDLGVGDNTVYGFGKYSLFVPG